jgi:hypothetical protein
MQFKLNQAFEVLAGTPGVLDALLRRKSAEWLNSKKTADAFSPIDVVGHLILADKTDWMPRVRMILDHGDTRPFDPFDRFAFQPLIEGKSIAELLDDFAQVRRESLQTLADLDLAQRQFDLRGLHPDLGAVTLGNLLSTWVVHDLGHISQIVKAMASAYGEAVGPWRAYLSILK